MGGSTWVVSLAGNGSRGMKSPRLRPHGSTNDTGTYRVHLQRLTGASACETSPDCVIDPSVESDLARFTAAVDRITDEDSGDVVIVSHGTVISLFVGARADVNAAELWATLGLPSYVALELPSHRIIEIVAAV